ncbi:MAG: hypothetical protein QM820_60260 [Minicystis sp.]
MRWRIHTPHGDYWIAPRGAHLGGAIELPREEAAWRAAGWFPDEPGAGLHRRTLVDIGRHTGAHGLDGARASVLELRDHLVEVLRRGTLRAYRALAPALGGGAVEGPPAPAPPPPAPAVTPVNPVINPATLVVVVRKFAANPGGGAPVAYTSPARQALTLTTDAPFDGTGTFTCPGGRVRFFSAATGGVEITFNGVDNVFPPNAAPAWAPAGATLAGGVTVFAEGASPSGAMDDVTATLHLAGGSRPVGPDDTSTLTSVEVTLDICKSRTRAQAGAHPPGDPDPLSQDDKINVGRFLHVQDATFDHGRAMLIVQAIRPAAFNRDLELRALDAKVRLFAADAPAPVVPGHAAPAAPAALGTQTIHAADLPKKFWAEGASVSGALVDTGFQLGISGIEPDGDRVRCTVVSFTQIQATIKSTPPITDRTALGFPLPVDHVFTTTGNSDDFTATPPLVLMRNAQPDIALQLTASPANLPVSWKAIRNPADHARLGGAGDLPTVTPDGADRLKATLDANQKGSFRVRPFIDCNGSGEWEDREPSIPLNLILADATVALDRTAAHQSALRATIDATGVSVRNGTWAAGAVLHTPDLHAAGCGMNLTCDVTGGGANGRLGLDRVFGGFINDLRNVDISAVYVDTTGGAPVNHTYTNVYVSNLASATGVDGNGDPIFKPGDPAPATHTFPILDTGRYASGSEGRGADTAVMGRSNGPQNVTNRPVGQRWTIRCIDSPGRWFDRFHPNYPAAELTSIHYRHEFTGFFSFWTNVTAVRTSSGDPAERVYCVLRTITWGIVADWTVNYHPAHGGPQLTATTPHRITAAGATVNPLGRAQDNNCEVRPPSGIASVVTWDGR